jgi:hypothetical protein
MALETTGKVFNRNKYPLVDEYKGRKIHIEPGQSIDMDYYDYIEFKGQIPTSIRDKKDMFDGSGNQKPTSFKMLEYKGPVPESQSDGHVCQMCRGKFASLKQLESHTDEWHLDKLEDKELAEERRAKQNKERQRA